MSSGAVVASDPGGGEPKLVAGADVEMTDPAEEVAAPAAAEVKVEGKARVLGEGDAAAAMDVEQEGGEEVVAVSDPLYATESAGMVTEEGRADEAVEGAEGVNGGAGGQVAVQAGAGGVQSEAERKPVPAGDVAAPAVARQAVESAGSASSEHAEAGSNKLEENYVNADPGKENKEQDNGVAHCGKEIIQNNVPVDAKGSSQIHDDNGAPVVDQPDDRSEMLPQTGEHVPGSGNNPSSNNAASPGNIDQCARYCLPPLDKDGFRVSDLVWGKVKSHPWWPGEIFDPSDASELALKHQKKDSHLVAYFGDNTFAWCDESQLKPFMTNYSQMEKQSSSDAFVGSVNNALEELSRRILSGMSCSCLPEELSDSGMSYAVENAGLKDGVTCSAVNRSEILKFFSPESLLHYMKELALFPGQGGDLLELVIACSQLTSFYRSKGCPELASFQSGSAWVEDGMDTPSTHNEMVEEAVIHEVHPTQEKPKRGRGRPRKQKPEDDQEAKEKKGTSNLSNVTAFGDTVDKQMVMDFDDFDNLQNKKKRNLDSFEDSEKPSAPTGGSSFKIGECIRRAASQLTGSSSIVKPQNELALYKNAGEAENGEFDISSDDAGDELTVQKQAKRRRIHRNQTADPKELLSQLCLVATEPMNGYSFSATIISYFSDFRNYVVSTTTEASIVEKGTGRRGRKRKVLPSPEVETTDHMQETTDHMQDSYWSGLSLHNHPIHDLRKACTTTRPRRRRRSSRQTYVPLSDLGDSGPKKQIQVIERPIIHVDEKMVDELKPTALVLSFARSASVPSEMDLIKMFGRYGPLKETETEVHKDTNTVKVVFKKRVDAEIAFSVAGKYGTFGPSLQSYRLVNMPFSLSTLEANTNPGTHPEDRCPEVPGPSEPKAPLDVMQVDQVDKTEKAEVVGETLVQQVETDKQTSHMEAADKTLVSQVDMVDKTGQINAELTDQIGTAAQAESVAEGSSEQVSAFMLAYNPKEISVECLSEITQSGAATSASNGGTVDEVQRGEAPNQPLIDDTTNILQMKAASEAETEDTVMQASHADATNKKSAQAVSDNMQANVIFEAPKQVDISGDNAAVAELPTTAQVDAEADTATEVPEEGMEALELPSQTSNEKPVKQDITEQTVGSEAPKQVSGKVPCSTKLEAESLTEEPVGKVSVEQVKVQVESNTAVKSSGEQLYSSEQTVHVEAITEASGEQTEVGRKTPEDESMADATIEHSVMVQETVESKVEVPLEENVENAAAAAAAVGLVETAEGQMTVEAPDEKIETKAAADALAGETVEGEVAVETLNEEIENKATAAEVLHGDTREGEVTVEAPDVKTENEATVETITGEKAEGESTAEAPDEDTRTGKETVEDVKALVEKTTKREKTVEDATVVAPVEKTTIADKSVENATVETPDGKTTEVEKTVEDAMVETPHEKTTEVEKPVEDAMVETPDGKTTEIEKTVEDTNVDTPDGKTTEVDKPVEDAMVETPDGKTTEVEKTVEDTIVETPDGKTTEVEKAVEDAAVEAPDEKSSAADKTAEDTTVEAPGVQAGASEQTG